MIFSGLIGLSSMDRQKGGQVEQVKNDEIMRGKKKLGSYEVKNSKADDQDKEKIPNSPDKNLSAYKDDAIWQINENTTLAHNVDENYAVSKIIDAVNQLSKEKSLRPRITFLDFAGQSLYYAFHQIYLSPKTCYILVVDMTKDLKDRVPDTDEQCASRFTSWTYEGKNFEEGQLAFTFCSILQTQILSLQSTKKKGQIETLYFMHLIIQLSSTILEIIYCRICTNALQYQKKII